MVGSADRGLRRAFSNHPYGFKGLRCRAVMIDALVEEKLNSDNSQAGCGPRIAIEVKPLGRCGNPRT